MSERVWPYRASEYEVSIWPGIWLTDQWIEECRADPEALQFTESWLDHLNPIDRKCALNNLQRVISRSEA